MNIALPRTGTSRRTTVIGMVLASSVLAVAAGLGVWQLSDSGSSSSSPAASPSIASQGWMTHSDKTLLLYLVDSDAQADMVRAGDQEAANERATSGMADPNYSLVILKVTTPEEEANVREVMEAWSTNGNGIMLEDIRGR